MKAQTSEVRFAKPPLRWLWGGFGFKNSESLMTGLMTDEFRDERALKSFLEISPSYSRVFAGFADWTKEAMDRFADYYDRTFRKAGTTLYAVPCAMPALAETLDAEEYAEKVAGLPNVVLRAEPDKLPSASFGWAYRAAPSADGGTALMADISATGWKPPARVVGALPHVFAEFRRTANGFALFLLNYDPDKPAEGVSIFAPTGREIRFEETPGIGTHATPLAPATDGAIRLPAFKLGAFVELEMN